MGQTSIWGEKDTKRIGVQEYLHSMTKNEPLLNLRDFGSHGPRFGDQNLVGLYIILDETNNVDQLREPLSSHLKNAIVRLLPLVRKLVLQGMNQVSDGINASVDPYLHQFVAVSVRIHQEDHDWNSIVTRHFESTQAEGRL